MQLAFGSRQLECIFVCNIYRVRVKIFVSQFVSPRVLSVSTCLAICRPCFAKSHDSACCSLFCAVREHKARSTGLRVLAYVGRRKSVREICKMFLVWRRTGS